MVSAPERFLNDIFLPEYGEMVETLHAHLTEITIVVMLSVGGTYRYVTCQLLRAYAGPGTTVGYGVGTSGGSAQSSNLTISGHLVDVP